MYLSEEERQALRRGHAAHLSSPSASHAGRHLHSRRGLREPRRRPGGRDGRHAKYDLVAIPVVATTGTSWASSPSTTRWTSSRRSTRRTCRSPVACLRARVPTAGTCSWFLRRQYWFFWMGHGPLVTIACSGRPSAPLSEMLLVCSAHARHRSSCWRTRMVSFVTNYFLENDPDDEDSPSMLGFTIKSRAWALPLPRWWSWSRWRWTAYSSPPSTPRRPLRPAAGELRRCCHCGSRRVCPLSRLAARPAQA